MDSDKPNLCELLLNYANLGTNPEQMKEALGNASVETRYDALMKTRSDTAKNTPVHRAAAWNDMDSTRHMLSGFTATQQYTVLKIQSQDAKTAIHFASQEGYTDMLFHLLEDLSSGHRFEILKLQDVDGNTALHAAAICKDANALCLLLAAVTPDHKDQLLSIKNRKGETAKKITKLPDLSYRYSHWNFLGLKHAKERIGELETTVKRLTTQTTKQAAELESYKQKVEELERRLPKHYDEIEIHKITNESQPEKSLTELSDTHIDSSHQRTDQLKRQIKDQEKEIQKLKAEYLEIYKMIKGQTGDSRRCFSTGSTRMKQTSL